MGDRISDGFAARLRKLKSDSTVRAVVMLRRDAPAGQSSRAAQVKTVRQSARAALAEVDIILQRFGGARLAHRPNALGYIPVETTPDGIRALAESDAVRGVLEDQPVRLAI